MAGVPLFLTSPTVAFAAGEALVLAAGYVGHAVWDAIHHDKGVHTRITWWYVPSLPWIRCAVRVYVLLRFG